MSHWPVDFLREDQPPDAITLVDEARILELLDQVGHSLTSRLDLLAVVQALTDAGTEISGARFGTFVSHAAAGGKAQDWRPMRNNDVKAGDTGTAAELGLTNTPFVVRSLMLVPVTSRPGEILGALVFAHDHAGVFTERSERILGGLAAQAAVAIDNVRLYSRVRQEVGEHKLLLEQQRVHLNRLQQLSRRLMDSQEYERKRLGRELHDRVGSNLSALLMGLKLARSEPGADDSQPLGKRLSDLDSVVLSTMDLVRDVLADLRPTALDELGLVPALRHQAAVLSARTKVEFVVEGCEPSPRLKPACEIAFYRVAQETWMNALKHAHATRVTTTLREEGDRLFMQIEDDGQGFDAAARDEGRPALGLTTMAERAEAIGARLDIESAPDKGVRVTLSVAAQLCRQEK